MASPTHAAPRSRASCWWEAAGGDVDFAVPGFEDVDSEMRGSAEAEEADAIAGCDLRDAQTAEADDAGTEQRGEVGGGFLFGEWDEEIGAGDGVFSVAAVDGVAGIGGVVAEILAVFQTEQAGAIDATEPGDSDPLANADGVDAGAEFFDTRDDLVAGRDGVAERLQLAGGDVEVGATDAAGFDLKQDLAGARFGDRQVFKDQRARGDGGGVMKDGGTHHLFRLAPGTGRLLRSGKLRE